jgi:hypothetical protein
VGLIAHQDGSGDRHLPWKARGAMAYDEADTPLDGSPAHGSRDQGQLPAPVRRLLHRGVVRADATAQGPQERRNDDEDDVPPRDRLALRHPRLDDAAHPARCRRVLACHGRDGGICVASGGAGTRISGVDRNGICVAGGGAGARISRGTNWIRVAGGGAASRTQSQPDPDRNGGGDGARHGTDHRMPDREALGRYRERTVLSDATRPLSSVTT